MITFGQGLNRAHPNLINIVNTLEKGDDLKGFTKEVLIQIPTMNILIVDKRERERERVINIQKFCVS